MTNRQNRCGPKLERERRPRQGASALLAVGFVLTLGAHRSFGELICHAPNVRASAPAARATLLVADNAVPGHVQHGDALGACATPPAVCEALTLEEQLEVTARNVLLARSGARERGGLVELAGAYTALPVFDKEDAPPSLRAIAQCIDAESAANDSFVGFAYALVRAGEVVHGGRGFSRAPWEDQAPGVPMTAETPIHWASVTKVFTAVAVLKVLAQEGISLDDPFLATTVGPFRWVFWLGDPQHQQVTFRHLLQHTSGYRSGSCDFDALVATFAEPPVTVPGSHPEYANINYCLLEMFVEHFVFPRSFETFVYDEILVPAGVSGVGCSTTSEEAVRAAPTLSLQYSTLDIPQAASGLAQTWPVYPNGICGPGGYHGPVVSLARLLNSLRSDAVLAPELREKLVGECFAGNSPCLGFHRIVGEVGDYYVHNGGLTWILCKNPDCSEVTNPQGIGSFMARLPFDVDGAIATNTQGSSMDFAAVLLDCYEAAVREANLIPNPD